MSSPKWTVEAVGFGSDARGGLTMRCNPFQIRVPLGLPQNEKAGEGDLNTHCGHGVNNASPDLPKKRNF